MSAPRAGGPGRAGRAVYVSGAAAVGAWGFGWRGLGQRIKSGALRPAAARQLAASHGSVMAFEVPAIPASLDAEARSLKLMSHPARLGAVALRLALAEAGWTEASRVDTGLFMGVGASGGGLQELTAMLDASTTDREFSLSRFGQAGLAACNPLYAFQLMNNFSLCHGAILQGVGGPNSAFYSRGTGTLAALSEAHWQVGSGRCDQALAGATDSALHPVTWHGLCQQVCMREGRVPGEGAALLALSAASNAALARLTHVAYQSAASLPVQPVSALLAEVAAQGEADVIVLSASDAAARALWVDALSGSGREGSWVETASGLGEALAATPALAWCVALDLLQDLNAQRAWVLSAGPDGGVGAVVLESAT